MTWFRLFLPKRPNDDSAMTSMLLTPELWPNWTNPLVRKICFKLLCLRLLFGMFFCHCGSLDFLLAMPIPETPYVWRATLHPSFGICCTTMQTSLSILLEDSTPHGIPKLISTKTKWPLPQLPSSTSMGPWRIWCGDGRCATGERV